MVWCGKLADMDNAERQKKFKQAYDALLAAANTMQDTIDSMEGWDTRVDHLQSMVNDLNDVAYNLSTYALDK